MSFNTSWDVNLCKIDLESLDRWKFRETFLILHKYKYPRERLLVLCDIFINIEFENCKYSKPTMDLIENLTKGFVFHLRNILNLPKITNSNVAGAKDYENAYKKMKDLTPWDENFIIPGFMLLVNTHRIQSQYQILEQSCVFNGIEKPEIRHKHLDDDHYQARLYLQNKLIAIGNAIEREYSTSLAWNNALQILLEMCFVIKVKEYKQSRITLLDVMDDSKIGTSTYTMHHSKVSENKVGKMILKNMGWKEGDGLGKNNQGITSPIETINFKKRFGLDIKNYDTNINTNRTHLMDFSIQAEKYIMRFLYSPKIRLSFSTEFTKDERKIIHAICTEVGIWTKTYEKKGNKQQINIVKQQTPQQIFDELINCSNFENDYYILQRPNLESNNNIQYRFEIEIV